MLNNDSIAVLGRGRSLERAGHLSFLNDFVVVNFQNEEFLKEPVKSLLKNKNIIQVMNIHERIQSTEIQKKYNIKYIFSRFKEDGSKDELRKPRTSFNPEKLGLEVGYFPDILEPHLKRLPNTGIASIIYVVVALKKKHIYIAGIDFYDSDYFNYDVEEKYPGFWKRQRERKYNEEMKYVLNDFMKKNPKTEFHIITDSSYKSDLPNVEVIK